jgi:hypothetical protein
LGPLAIFALAFIIFWVFLRYLTTEQSPPDDKSASFLLSRSFVQPA